ncbi:MAG: T9SS type A sorting domain-containing protein [Crocinitomicaceae bacterium]
MKQLLLLFTLFLGLNSFATIYVGNVTINSQADITTFFNNNPGTTEIQGSLFIDGNVPDLSPLNSLINISQTLEMKNNHILTTVNGFNNLVSVNKLQIYQCNSLLSLNGFNSLLATGGDVNIFSNPSLTSLLGLNVLKNIGGSFQCILNVNLISFNGLNALETIGKAFICAGNDNLVSFNGLNLLNSIDGTFRCSTNNSLTSISDLLSLTSIGGNSYLTFFGFTGGVRIHSNPFLNPFSIYGICDYLSAPTTMSFNLDIHSNTAGCNSVQEVLLNCTPPSQLTAAYCGSQLTASNDFFYCDPVVNATNYEFEFTELDGFGQPTSNINTHIRPIPSDNLILAGVAYVDVSYNVRVKAEANGIWGAYGPVCQLHAQSQPGFTQLSVPYCGVQLTTFSEMISCHSIIDATDYRFEFVELDMNSAPTGVVVTHDRNHFTESLTMAGLGLLNTLYSVRVKVKVNGVWGDYGQSCLVNSPLTVPNTQLSSTYCNTTLTSMGQSFFCNAVSGATQYRFEIYEQGSFVAPIEYTNNWNNCNLIAASFTSLNTVYDVRVKAMIGGVWGTYSTLCQVTSPASIPLTQLKPAWCGGQVSTFNQLFSCDVVSGAVEYRFKFTDPSTGSSFTNLRSLPTNRLSLVNSFPLDLGVDYNVEVQARIGSIWGGYGPVCILTSPHSVPVTQLGANYCNTTLTSIGQTFYCSSVSGASEYIFRITPSGGSAFDHSRTWHSEKLTWAGFSSLNTTYTVQVKARIGVNWGAFGSSCTVTTGNAMILNPNDNGFSSATGLHISTDGGSLGLGEHQDYEIKVYPNPTVDIINLYTDAENYSATIMSLSGQVIQKGFRLNGQTSFDLESVAAGLYLVSIHNENGELIKSNKITVTK